MPWKFHVISPGKRDFKILNTSLAPSPLTSDCITGQSFSGNLSKFEKHDLSEDWKCSSILLLRELIHDSIRIRFLGSKLVTRECKNCKPYSRIRNRNAFGDRDMPNLRCYICRTIGRDFCMKIRYIRID
jgi:hypothetical protein